MEFWKIALAGGAAFLGYEYFTGGLTTMLGTPTATGPTGAIPVTPPASTVTIPAVTAGTLATKAGAPTQNIFQWNYWYAALTGAPNADIPNNTKWPVDGSSIIDAQTYLNYRSTLGIGGLGQIINLGPLFAGRHDPTGFGDEEFRAGLSGLGRIENEPANNAAYIDVQPIIDGASRNGSLDSSTQAFYDALKG